MSAINYRNKESLITVGVAVQHSEICETIIAILTQNNIQTYCANSLSDIDDIKRNYHPNIFIVDIKFPNKNIHIFDDINNIYGEHRDKSHIIYGSHANDLLAQISALRSQSGTLITYPIDSFYLLNKIFSLTNSNIEDPYRILIIEDSKTQAKLIASILSAANIIHKIENDPLNALTTIAEFQPELILMDIHMPHCSGLELGAIIRQHDEYVSLPIVYLSSDSSTDTQINSLSLGGDTFLHKPIKPTHLVSVTSMKAKRYRALRQLMMYDMLTNVLNRNNFFKNLHIELQRSQRNNTNIVIIFTKIDAFKTIEKQYGSQICDYILIAWSNILKQRLRCTDIIGRISNHHFGLLLPQTNIEQAQQIIIQLNSLLQQCNFNIDDNSTITVSCSYVVAPHKYENNCQRILFNQIYTSCSNMSSLLIEKTAQHTNKIEILDKFLIK